MRSSFFSLLLPLWGSLSVIFSLFPPPPFFLFLYQNLPLPQLQPPYIPSSFLGLLNGFPLKFNGPYQILSPTLPSVKFCVYPDFMKPLFLSTFTFSFFFWKNIRRTKKHSVNSRRRSKMSRAYYITNFFLLNE